MAISRQIQSLLSKGDFDGIESLCLEHLEQHEGDLDFFVGVARAMVGQNADDRSQALLEMLDEQLAESGRHHRRLALMRRVGGILDPKPESLHDRILEALAALHSGVSWFDGAVETVGLDKAPGDIPKTWDKADRLEALMAFDTGTVVAMEGRGSGRVGEVNLPLKSLRVDFPGHPPLMVGFRAAAKMLTPLDEDHVLYRRLTDPDSLIALSKEDPSELLRLVLVSAGRPLKGAEVRKMVDGIVPTSRWSSWWTAARKHPQVVAGTGGRQTYAWAASSEDATESLWEAFQKAHPRARIDQLRRHGERDADLRKRMSEALAETGQAVFEEDPGLAFEIFVALERAGHAPDEADWSGVAIAARDGRALLAGVTEKAAKIKAYEAVREAREDWQEHFLAGLPREEDPRLLTVLADSLAESDPERLGRALDDILSAPHKSPAPFVWLTDRAAEDEALRDRNPLRFLQQVLIALTRPELAPFRVRLAAQCESGGLVPRLLAHLSADDAPEAVAAIGRASALERYQREDLTTALELRFPALRQEEEQPLYALETSIAAKRAELKEILEEEIPTNRKAIQEAREMGDLRENFEYKSARQRHEYLTARAEELNAQLERSRLLDPETVDASKVRVGTTVELELEGSGAKTLTILGPWESDPDQGVISFESELAAALLDSGVGDSVTVAGTTYTVQSIDRARI